MGLTWYYYVMSAYMHINAKYHPTTLMSYVKGEKLMRGRYENKYLNCDKCSYTQGHIHYEKCVFKWHGRNMMYCVMLVCSEYWYILLTIYLKKKG